MEKINRQMERMVDSLDGSFDQALSILNKIFEDGSEEQITEALATFIYSNMELSAEDVEFDFSGYSPRFKKYLSLLVEGVQCYYHRQYRKAIGIFENLITINSLFDIADYFLAVIYSHLTHRDTDKMFAHLDRLDDYKLIDIFIFGETSLKGLPEINIIPLTDNPNNVYLSLYQAEQKLKELGNKP